MDITQFYPEIHILLSILTLAVLVVVLWFARKLGVTIEELRLAIQIIKGNQREIKNALNIPPKVLGSGERSGDST